MSRWQGKGMLTWAKRIEVQRAQATMLNNITEFRTSTFSLSQNIVLVAIDKLFMLAEHFIMSEDNQTTMPLYGLLS